MLSCLFWGEVDVEGGHWLGGGARGLEVVWKWEGQALGYGLHEVMWECKLVKLDIVRNVHALWYISWILVKKMMSHSNGSRKSRILCFLVWYLCVELHSLSDSPVSCSSWISGQQPCMGSKCRQMHLCLTLPAVTKGSYFEPTQVDGFLFLLCPPWQVILR